MATSKKAAPTAPKATAKKAAVKKVIHHAPAAHKEEPVTIDTLIEGARANIDHQMEQSVFAKLSRNDIAKAHRDSLKREALLNPDLTEMNATQLHKYLTAELEIDDSIKAVVRRR